MTARALQYAVLEHQTLADALRLAADDEPEPVTVRDGCREVDPCAETLRCPVWSGIVDTSGGAR